MLIPVQIVPEVDQKSVFFVMTFLASPRTEVVMGGGEGSQCDGLILIVFWCMPDKILYTKDIIRDEGAEVG